MLIRSSSIFAHVRNPSRNVVAVFLAAGGASRPEDISSTSGPTLAPKNEFLARLTGRIPPLSAPVRCARAQSHSLPRSSSLDFTISPQISVQPFQAWPTVFRSVRTQRKQQVVFRRKRPHRLPLHHNRDRSVHDAVSVQHSRKTQKAISVTVQIHPEAGGECPNPSSVPPPAENAVRQAPNMLVAILENIRQPRECGSQSQDPRAGPADPDRRSYDGRALRSTACAATGPFKWQPLLFPPGT